MLPHELTKLVQDALRDRNTDDDTQKALVLGCIRIPYMSQDEKNELFTELFARLHDDAELIEHIAGAME